jgi:hypothetical protein
MSGVCVNTCEVRRRPSLTEGPGRDGASGIEQTIAEADPPLRMGGMLDAWTLTTRWYPLCINC